MADLDTAVFHRSNMMAGVSIEILDRCPSTNDYLRSNYQALETRFPLLVTARQQSNGRGRGKNSWVSARGLSLTSSLGIRLRNREALRYISLAAGEAVIQVLHSLSGDKFLLKWPNDVCLKGRKIAGVLVDTILTGNSIVVIIGVGVNLNHCQEDFPPDLRDRAISLYMGTGQKYTVETMNTRLAAALMHRVKALEKGKIRPILRRIRRLCRPLLNTPVTFRDHRQNRVKGIFKGIDRGGGARIYHQNSGTRIYYSGEMQLSPPGGG